MGMQDAELLRSYLKDGSEEAFTELVSRYAGLVYSTASRQLGDASLAEEVSQTVFCVLARKAGSLSGKPTLAGWLYRATWFAAAKARRAERRRRRLEEEASQMNVDDPAVEATWAHLSPMLDLALNQLGEKERLAVLLRFFQRKPMREIGQTLGVTKRRPRCAWAGQSST